jgi:hypothetical protein
VDAGQVRKRRVGQVRVRAVQMPAQLAAPAAAPASGRGGAKQHNSTTRTRTPALIQR